MSASALLRNLCLACACTHVWMQKMRELAEQESEHLYTVESERFLLPGPMCSARLLVHNPNGGHWLHQRLAGNPWTVHLLAHAPKSRRRVEQTIRCVCTIRAKTGCVVPPYT
jgi:hypothetical protein